MKLWKNKKMNKNVVQTSNCEEPDENAMKRVFGSGNSQVRYISDEYIQAKILKMRIGV